MQLITFFGLTIFLFLAIVGGIIGIVLEGRRNPASAHNPATTDTVYPIVGWSMLFALYLALELVGEENLTPQFKRQLGTLAVLPLFYAVLATARLIWRSARRIHASLRGGGPPAWRPIPFLRSLAAPTLFAAAVCAAVTQLAYDGFSLSFLLLASVATLLAFIRTR